MALEAGRKLGPYEIVAAIGAGGMGEVYRARDARLDRDVAIKVLPAAMSRNAHFAARFEREAKTVSSFNHAHICVLHDIGHEDGVAFLVMELLEGETLADRIAKGPLPNSEVLKIGAQIADALDRAHQAGVVHRDLKPANVMLTRSGAKLMDFGLARAADTGIVAGEPDGTTPPSQSPTLAQPLTAEGAIVGTFQYMAPEQLEGKEADARADLWALGCVMYEMATGRRTFEGKSQASLIGSIMHADPRPVSALSPLSPPELDRLVAACLAKKPADRVHSAHDVKLQLTWLAEGSGSTAQGLATEVQTSPEARKRPPLLAHAVTALFTAAVTITIMLGFLPPGEGPTESQSPPQRYILGTEDLQPTSGPVFSPDGTFVVFSKIEGVSCQLYRRDLSSFAATPIAGTEEGLAPFFSPDGAWIGFVTPGSIKRVPVEGGVPQLVVDTPAASAGDWGENGYIYFTYRSGGPDGTVACARVRETGGEIEVVARLDTDAGEYQGWLPEILPDGETVLYSVLGGTRPRTWAARSDGSRHVVIENGFLGRYVEPGYVVYGDFGSMAVVVAPFDLEEARLTGPAIPLTEKVNPTYGYDVHGDRKLIYVPMPGEGGGDQLVWLDREGNATPVLDTLANWGEPRISPDGRRIIVRKTGANCELWLADLETGSLSRLVHDGDVHEPSWAPDGRHVLYNEMNERKLVKVTVGGARRIQIIAQGQETGIPGSWSANGNRVIYTLRGQETGDDLWIRYLDDPASPEPFLVTENHESRAAFSPDGSWITYVSDVTGTPEVFVRSYPDAGSVWQISTDGGRDPVWSWDGSELLFASGRKMMAARVETGPAGEFMASMPVELFESYLGSSWSRDYDPAPDGRFLTVRRAGSDEGGQEMRVLLSWRQQMERTSGGRMH